MKAAFARDARRRVEGLIRKVVGGEASVRADHADRKAVLAMTAAGRHDEALLLARRGVARRPRDAGLHEALGRALAAMDRHEEAVGCFRNAIALGRRGPGLYLFLGRSLRHLETQGESDRAIRSAPFVGPATATQAFLEALRTDPKHEQSLLELANTADAAADLEAVRGRIDTALSVSPASPKVLSMRARIAFQYGDVAAAMTDLQQVALLSPEKAQAERDLAVVARHLPKPDQASGVLPARQANGTFAVALGAGIGNMIQCSPAIRRLSEHIGSPVDILLNSDFPGCETLFAGAPWVGSVMESDAETSRIRYETLFVFDSFGPLVPPFKAGRLILSRRTMPFAMTRRIHEAEFNLQCVHRLLGVPYQLQDVRNYFIGGTERGAPVEGRIALHAGSKTGIWAAKRWPHFEALAKRLVNEGFEVVSVGSADEYVSGTIDATGTSLPDTIEAIRHCSYLIVNDSGLMHVADALAVPLSAIFAPSSILKNGPLSASSQVIGLAKGCAPCQFEREKLRTCRCIDEISSDDVYAKVMEHLARCSATEAPPSSCRQKPVADGSNRDEPDSWAQRRAFEAMARRHAAASLPERLELAIADEDARRRALHDLERRHFSGDLATGLIEIGAADVLWDLVVDLCAQPDRLLDLDKAGFAVLLKAVCAVGADEPFMAAVEPRIGAFAERHVDQVSGIFECAALVLAPDDFDRMVVAAAAPLLRGQSRLPIHRLVSIARKYGSVDGLLRLLRLIDGSAHAAMLVKPDFMKTIGDVLVKGTSPFYLRASRISDVDFRAAASNEAAILDAIHRRDRRRFIDHVNHFLVEGHGALPLAVLLRSMTAELSGLEASGAIRYRPSERREDSLALAVILNDSVTIGSQLRGQGLPAADALDAVGLTMAALQVAWQTRLNDYGPLNDALAAWLAADRIAPIRLEGRTQQELFRSAFEDHSLADADDHGKISIIMSVFNPDITLARLAIRSVLAQTYRNLELIIVDDGSDGGASRDVAAFASLDQRIRVIRNPTNAGPYHCRNLALRIATGSAIGFHDADDVAHPQRLEVQLRTLLEADHVELCFGSHIRFDADGALQFEFNHKVLHLLGDGPVTALFRSRALDIAGDFAPVRSRGDVEMRSRIRQCFGSHAVRHLAAPLIVCAGASTSLSNKARSQHAESVALFSRRFARRLLPPVLDGALISPIVGSLPIPFPLRSGTAWTSSSSRAELTQRKTAGSLIVR